MLVNISNHPSSGWSEEQLMQAGKWGKIKDITFPTIDPGWDTGAIRHIAQAIVEMASESFNPSWDVFHVMGEMGLTFHLVTLLKEKGFVVVHSTTERVVEEDSKGRKVSTFRFVKFREY